MGINMKIATLNSENIVENIIQIDSEMPDFLNDLDWLDVSESDISVGQEYFPALQKFKPFQTRQNFIFDEESWQWVHPIAPPEDATWIPELQEKPDGHDELEIKKVYFWMDKYQAWGLGPCDCNPRPSDQHYWNPLDKEWQIPDLEKPEGNYAWNTLERIWVEISEFTNPD